MEPENAKSPKSHLVEAFHWSTETKTDWVEVLASAIGMAAPIVLGAALGELALGLGMAVGSLLVGGTGAGRDWRAQIKTLAAALAAAAAAASVAVAVSGHGWVSDGLVTLLAGAAAILAAMGRPVATMAIRFILLLVIAVSVADGIAGRGGLLLLIMAGGLWTAAVSLLLGALARMRRSREDSSADTAPAPMTLRQRLARWRRVLAHLAGWQYALRLVICLSVAGALRWLWPDHHLYWIALTVALLAEWQIEAFPVKTTQRALGAAAGVLATGLLLVYTPPAWALVAVMGVLAGLRPLLRARNYLAYTAAMTPLIILLLDAGQLPGRGVLIDRLVATLIGAALVIATNLLFKKMIGKTV
jgi:Fusaric acid resistance protein-like